MIPYCYGGSRCTSLAHGLNSFALAGYQKRKYATIPSLQIANSTAFLTKTVMCLVLVEAAKSKLNPINFQSIFLVLHSLHLTVLETFGIDSIHHFHLVIMLRRFLNSFIWVFNIASNTVQVR